MNETELVILKSVEEALGENLHWISDKFDLEIRQQDHETIKRLRKMQVAWAALARLIAIQNKEVA